MTSKLTVYNLALGHLRERKLSGLSEAREPRRVLDDYWDHVVTLCLEEAYWNFVKRSVSITASTTITPEFGYTNAFAKPVDFLRLVNMSASEDLKTPLLDFKDEPGYWYADVDPIYVEYNSSDVNYGMDLGQWSASFTDYVALQLAEQACNRITGNDSLLEGANGISRRLKKAKVNAKAKDAMNDPVGFAPTGSWVNSRGSWRGKDRPPSSGSLIS